jgi:adhesin transport system outer membrane protein
MITKKFILTILGAFLCSVSSEALTLKESVNEVVRTNPVVQERLKNYRATQQDLNIAESEYYPSLDLRASVGYTESGNLKNSNGDDWDHPVADQSYGNYESSLILTQNIFDGFATMNKVDYQEARILAAAYNYVEKANDIAFKMTSAYINVIKSYELVQTARENVQINESIYNKVKDLYESGLTTDSEVKKIQSSLSLARSNLTVQINNAKDNEYSFRRLLGRMPNVESMKKPTLNLAMPQNIQKAALYALNHNPSLIVSRYNIKSAQSLYKQNKKEFYPKIDLELSQNFNDNDYAGGTPSFSSPDDRFQAKIVLNYNLFRGGADSANVQKLISKINQEIEIKRDLKRQVIEGLDLSWNSYEMITLQLKDLREYRGYSEKTLELYKEEYDLGRRSLLDLLSSQNDVINSRSQIISAEYDLLFAKYRILDAMGLLPLAILGDTKELTAQVNLYTDADADEILDVIPVKLDADNDNIVDNQDLCDNSLMQNNIMPYGCVKMKKDSDHDGVIDSKDRCALTPKGALVSADGCAIDQDMDGVKDFEDQCLHTPVGYSVDMEGCAESTTITANFKRNSATLPDTIEDRVVEFAKFMQDNPDYVADIIGHTSRTPKSDADFNIKLSKRRAEAFKNAAVKLGVDPQRLNTEGRGFEEPIGDNTTVNGRYLNRRIEILFSK